MSLGDAGCYGAMIGCGETYLPAFALALGLGETSAGLVASLPLLAGGIMQLLSPLAIRWIGSLKVWIVLGAALQALAFVPLILAAQAETLSLQILLLIASIYWGAGLATGPAWNTWMEEIVPSRVRAGYFAGRTRLQQTTTFSTLIVSGIALQFAADRGATLVGFAGLFALAMVFRLMSAGFLASHRVFVTGNEVKRLAATTGKALPGMGKRLLCYLVLVQGVVQICGPFFTPYMLGQLELDYSAFVAFISIAFVAKVLTLSLCGHFVQRYGASRLLGAGVIGLVPLPAMWIVSGHFV